MRPRQNRYSVYLRPIAYCIDLALILVFALQFDFSSEEYLYYGVFVTLGWFFLSLNSGFYKIYRYTKAIQITSLCFLQLVLFGLIVFSFFGIFPSLAKPVGPVLLYLSQVLTGILLAKLGIYYLLQRYRKYWGGNYRTLIIIGKNNKTRQLFDFFKNNPIYGYKHKKTFDIEADTPTTDTNAVLEACFDYVLRERIDEIYCSSSVLSNKQIKRLVNFTDNNLIVLKFIPDKQDIYTRHLKLDHYGYLPVLSFRNVPINEPLNRVIKRSMDIVLSFLVIVFILSWLTPILAILIKLNSRGPVFFQQLRNGLNNEEFYCYKFRSMGPVGSTPEDDQLAKKQHRVTRIGHFLRKTSIDELPQFFNVFRGNMSIVGPRPHMISDTNAFADRVDKFMVRHFVKPGITGLAQVSGYRGEIETKNDIANRVKYDIFYVENWSVLLDIKIMFQTAFNIIKGDKKAY